MDRQMELSHEECGYTITVAEGRVSKDDGRGRRGKISVAGYPGCYGRGRWRRLMTMTCMKEEMIERREK